MRIGFDNDKYLSMQSEHIRDRRFSQSILRSGSVSLVISYIWNLVVNCLMITMHPEFCRDFSRTVNYRC